MERTVYPIPGYQGRSWFRILFLKLLRWEATWPETDGRKPSSAYVLLSEWKLWEKRSDPTDGPRRFPATFKHYHWKYCKKNYQMTDRISKSFFILFSCILNKFSRLFTQLLLWTLSYFQCPATTKSSDIPITKCTKM